MKYEEQRDTCKPCLCTQDFNFMEDDMTPEGIVRTRFLLQFHNETARIEVKVTDKKINCGNTDERINNAN